MKQHEAVILTMEKLGGVATLGQLNRDVLKVPGCEWKTRTPFASIRRIVQLRREIYKIMPGLYGLTALRPGIEARGILREPASGVVKGEIAASSHAYYQGLLLLIGRMREFTTFAPDQDRNRVFLSDTIGGTRTLDAIPSFSYPELTRRSRTVDALWFNERRMPAGFFEVELSTDFQNSLLKFVDLQDFAARMVIVSDARRRAEYRSKLGFSAFAGIRRRVEFLPFDSLVSQYESLMTSGAAEVRL